MGGVKVIVVTLVLGFFSIAAAGEKADAAKCIMWLEMILDGSYNLVVRLDFQSWRHYMVRVYSVAEDDIVELQTLEEFLSCDLSNPLKMYSDGQNKVPLEAEGAKYFASAKLDNCKTGLKLPVKVQPKVAAPGLTAPSPSTYITGIYYTFLGLMLCFFVV